MIKIDLILQFEGHREQITGTYQDFFVFFRRSSSRGFRNRFLKKTARSLFVGHVCPMKDYVTEAESMFLLI